MLKCITTISNRLGSCVRENDDLTVCQWRRCYISICWVFMKAKPMKYNILLVSNLVYFSSVLCTLFHFFFLNFLYLKQVLYTRSRLKSFASNLQNDVMNWKVFGYLISPWLMQIGMGVFWYFLVLYFLNT